MPLEQILKTIRDVLGQVPPELSADLAETGIMLTGGSALLRNLDRLIRTGVRLPVKVAPNPLSCVILGLAHQVNHLRRVRMGTIRKRTLNGRTQSKLLKPSARLTTRTATNSRKSTLRSI